ncbi:MAG: hypothetical protein GY822_23475 [Deltaproteobacteria bacterium]|nr:hypothetical protein [Deltaproteobacteria bacterium]
MGITPKVGAAQAEISPKMPTLKMANMKNRNDVTRVKPTWLSEKTFSRMVQKTQQERPQKRAVDPRFPKP